MEADLPVPGETQSATLRNRATLRAARYRLCWEARLRGPLREAAQQAVVAASAAALAAGGLAGADAGHRLSTELLPLLATGEDDGPGAGRATSAAGENDSERLTLGSFVKLASSLLGLRADKSPPEEIPDDFGEARDDGPDGNYANITPFENGHATAGSHPAVAGATQSAGSSPTDPPTSESAPAEGPALSFRAPRGKDQARDALCAKWMFGPLQSAWLAAETAPPARINATGLPPLAPGLAGAAGPPAVAAWRAMDRVLSPATVLVASRASRGTEFSSVWARPDCLVWAKQAKNFYWPAMLLWGSKTNPALRDVNVGRVPPAFREELEKQVSVSFRSSCKLNSHGVVFSVMRSWNAVLCLLGDFFCTFVCVGVS